MRGLLKNLSKEIFRKQRTLEVVKILFENLAQELQIVIGARKGVIGLANC